nr:MAG TPA: hypothetical protein [Caudoviricetes sp.]
MKDESPLGAFLGGFLLGCWLTRTAVRCIIFINKRGCNQFLRITNEHFCIQSTV